MTVEGGHCANWSTYSASDHNEAVVETTAPTRLRPDRLN
jgi:hypothetical protein